MTSASIGPIADLIDTLKVLIEAANPGPFGPHKNYGSITSDSYTGSDYPVDSEGYGGKTLICETVQEPNRQLIVALLNNAAGIVDALETLTEALENAGVPPETVDALARAQRKNGMKQKIQAARKEYKI